MENKRKSTQAYKKKKKQVTKEGSMTLLTRKTPIQKNKTRAKWLIPTNKNYKSNHLSNILI